MITCDECGIVKPTKNFCSPYCRVKHHRKKHPEKIPSVAEAKIDETVVKETSETPNVTEEEDRCRVEGCNYFTYVDSDMCYKHRYS